MRPLAMFVVPFLLISIGVAAKTDRSTLITDDVRRFLAVMQAGQFDDTLEERLRTSYFDPGTPGLAEYAERFGLTAESLAKSIRRYPDYYRSLSNIESRIAVQTPHIHNALTRMQALYPATDLGPVYFVVGALRAGGQNSSVGALISVEMFAADSDIPAEALPKGRLFPSSQLPIIIAHEMTHRQQVREQGIDAYLAIYDEKQSVLANAIREGTAEFVAMKTAGSTTDPESYAFGLAHEAEIWEAFHRDQSSRDYGDWFYVKPRSHTDWPPDLGYFIGARIVQSYYQNSPDKQAAITEIFGVTDYAWLLSVSGYGTNGFGD